MTFRAEYIWLDAAGRPRSKTRTITNGTGHQAMASNLPEWNFDGSSTAQAPGDNSEVIIKPVAIFKDPFRKENGVINYLVLCDCYDCYDKPLPSNTRAPALALFQQDLDQKPWFGIEQEYTLMDPENNRPLGWPVNPKHFPDKQGPYYCSAGADRSFGREIVEAHYDACLYSGITISGVNAEVMPGQWEFQVGPCEGIDSGDHLTVARYLLHRVCEQQGVVAEFHPKPVTGDWNGAGAHCNYSTSIMRDSTSPDAYGEILRGIERLSKRHMEHIKNYGIGNELRLTGLHETASITEFSSGVANRGCSIRIPRTTHRDQYGYMEDRRPASNMDPYVVTSKIFYTTILEPEVNFHPSVDTAWASDD